jgi:hypothetical protein
MVARAVLYGQWCTFGCFWHIECFHSGVITWVVCPLFTAGLVGPRLKQCVTALLQGVGCVGSVI